MKRSSFRYGAGSVASLVALIAALAFAIPAGADKQVVVVLKAPDGTTSTRTLQVGDSDPTDNASLTSRFSLSGEILSVTVSDLPTTTTTTTTTPAPKPKPKPRPRPRPVRHPKPAVRPAKKAAVKRTAMPAFGLPGLTPLGTPGELISEFSVPPFLLPIYQAAGIEYGIPWQVLAAINSIETDYGRNLSVSSAGALGWMQFMPATWKSYGVDANGDGKADPYNPVDAIFAAAKYLKASGGATDIKAAVFSYNHAGWYVDDVIHRARLLAGLPQDLVGSLTGLAQAMFPVAGKAAVRAPAGSGPSPTNVNVESIPNAPVIASSDGTVTALGRDRKRGNFITLRDAYGNTFTYTGLGRISASYVTRRDRAISAKELSKELKLEIQPEAGSGDSASDPADSQATEPAVEQKQRLFANPARPAAYRAGGAEQLAEAAGPADLRDWFTVPVTIPRKDAVIKRLQKGSKVIAGTILGRVNSPVGTARGTIGFGITPAGKGAPAIDPRPIITGWRLLAAVSRGADGARSASVSVGSPTIGQVLLMGKSELARRVLNDPRLTIYDCGRSDIEAGTVDQRVLATLEYLADHGMNPTVSSLHCGHSFLTSSGNVSEHSAGAAVDIAAINGVPILGHQGAGSITDRAVRALLALQGSMKPHQIITLMTYPGTDNTMALADHDDHIHVGFHPTGGLASLGAGARAVDSGQWTSLIERLREVPNPRVSTIASRYSTSPKRHD